jgi:hypothetical protein
MRQRIDDALFPGGAARAGRLGLPLRAPARSRRREPVLERRLPHDVDPVHLEGAHLVVLPPFQAVHHAAGVARVHHPALHRVLQQQQKQSQRAAAAHTVTVSNHTYVTKACNNAC